MLIKSSFHLHFKSPFCCSLSVNEKSMSGDWAAWLWATGVGLRSTAHQSGGRAPAVNSPRAPWENHRRAQPWAGGGGATLKVCTSYCTITALPWWILFTLLHFHLGQTGALPLIAKKGIVIGVKRQHWVWFKTNVCGWSKQPLPCV